MKKLIVILFILIILLFVISFFTSRIANNQNKGSLSKPTIINSQDVVNSFSYQGSEGVDALKLLKNKTEVKESQQGFVVAIGDRLADEKNKEFWSFYVNGELAPVGAAEYVTKNTDKIEWKIEKYE